MKTINKIILAWGLTLCTAIAQADIFFIYEPETGCQKSRLHYRSLDDYIMASRGSFGADFKVITFPLPIRDTSAAMMAVTLTINGKELNPIVVDGTAADCELLLQRTKETMYEIKQEQKSEDNQIAEEVSGSDVKEDASRLIDSPYWVFFSHKNGVKTYMKTNLPNEQGLLVVEQLKVNDSIEIFEGKRIKYDYTKYGFSCQMKSGTIFHVLSMDNNRYVIGGGENVQDGTLLPYDLYPGLKMAASVVCR